MTAVLLALGSSLAYGAADFLGGIAARQASVLKVVVIAAPASLVVELMIWPLIGADFAGGALLWGALSGLASAAAFALLYQALAVGPMSVLSPVTALVSAMLPVGAGLLAGEDLGALASIGVPLALCAVILVSSGTDDRAKAGNHGLLLALGAGAAIALQLICLDRAPADSGVAPLIIGRAVSSTLVIATALALLGRLGAKRPSFPRSAMAGALDSAANLAFLLAVRQGDLAVTAVITALYPAATVMLARLLLGERIGVAQWAGLGLAATAVSLLAAG